MTPYLDLLQDVLYNGVRKADRTGVGTLSVFGRQVRLDLSRGEFPAVTTKRLFWRGVVAELLWMLRGGTNARELQEQDVHIWDAWAREDGELGPVYGKQWRRWAGSTPLADSPLPFPVRVVREIDQVAQVVETLKTNPDSRRMLVSAWNVGELEEMALQPCPVLFQLYVAEGRLSLQVYQRSADLFLGVPFDIAGYALLTHMLAQVTGLRVGEYVHTFGDAHIYLTHLDQVREQLGRKPLPAPRLWLNPDVTSIDGFTVNDIKLLDYFHHPALRAPVAV